MADVHHEIKEESQKKPPKTSEIMVKGHSHELRELQTYEVLGYELKFFWAWQVFPAEFLEEHDIHENW